MTTIAQLKKYAKSSGFIQSLNDIGFQLGDGLWFYRDRDPYIDIIMFWISSTKNYFTVPVLCAKKDLVTQYDMNLFPKKFTKDIPFLTEKFVHEDGVKIGGSSWKVKTESDAENSLNELAKVINIKVDIWFKSITNDEELFHSYSLNMQETKKGKMMKSLLTIG